MNKFISQEEFTIFPKMILLITAQSKNPANLTTTRFVLKWLEMN